MSDCETTGMRGEATGKVAMLERTLTAIATGRDADGKHIDFPQDTAAAALGIVPGQWPAEPHPGAADEGTEEPVAAAPKADAMAAFIEQVARFDAYVWDELEGSTDEQGCDAIASMNDLIVQARALLGLPPLEQVGEQEA